MNDDRLSTDQPADVVPAELDLSPDGWRPPLSLRFVAFGFILVGTLSSVEMLLMLFVFRNIGFLLSVGLIQGALAWGLFVGRGLLKWRKSAREMAVALTWIALIFIPVWLLAVELDPPNRGFHDVTTTTSSVILHGGLWLYLVWQLRVLRRPDIVQRFQTTRFKRLMANGGTDPLGNSRWRFSLATLFWTVTIAAIVIVLVQLRTQDVLYEIRRVPTAHGFEYGVRSSRLAHSPDELAYVLFWEESNVWSWKQTGHGRGGRYYEEHGVQLPDGEEIVLPGRHQLYEFSDGTLRARSERLTLTELEDYMDSQPAEWSLDALVKHAAQMRAGKID